MNAKQKQKEMARAVALAGLGTVAVQFLEVAEDAAASALSVWASCAEVFERCGGDKAEAWTAINAAVRAEIEGVKDAEGDKRDGRAYFQPEPGEGVAVDAEGAPCAIFDDTGPSDMVRSLAGFSTLKDYINACARAVARGVSLFRADGTLKGRSQVQAECKGPGRKAQQPEAEDTGTGEGEGVDAGEGANLPPVSDADRVTLALDLLAKDADLRAEVSKHFEAVAKLFSRDKAEAARVKAEAAKSRKADAAAKVGRAVEREEALAAAIETRALITGESPEVARAAILAPSVPVAA